MKKKHFKTLALLGYLCCEGEKESNLNIFFGPKSGSSVPLSKNQIKLLQDACSEIDALELDRDPTTGFIEGFSEKFNEVVQNG